MPKVFKYEHKTQEPAENSCNKSIWLINLIFYVLLLDIQNQNCQNLLKDDVLVISNFKDKGKYSINNLGMTLMDFNGL